MYIPVWMFMTKKHYYNNILTRKVVYKMPFRLVITLYIFKVIKRWINYMAKNLNLTYYYAIHEPKVFLPLNDNHKICILNNFSSVSYIYCTIIIKFSVCHRLSEYSKLNFLIIIISISWNWVTFHRDLIVWDNSIFNLFLLFIISSQLIYVGTNNLMDLLQPFYTSVTVNIPLNRLDILSTFNSLKVFVRRVSCYPVQCTSYSEIL